MKPIFFISKNVIHVDGLVRLIGILLIRGGGGVQ